MALQKIKKNFDISTSRLRIKRITIKEANNNYLSWFNGKNDKFIVDAIEKKITLTYLKRYIIKNLRNNYTLFLAIHTKHKKHIGNIKFYNVDLKKKVSTLGIWIGNRNYLKKGLAYESLHACIKYLLNTNCINKFKLGVKNDNQPAIKLYKKIGFRFYKKRSFRLNMYLSKKNFKNVQ